MDTRLCLNSSLYLYRVYLRQIIGIVSYFEADCMRSNYKSLKRRTTKSSTIPSKVCSTEIKRGEHVEMAEIHLMNLGLSDQNLVLTVKPFASGNPCGSHGQWAFTPSPHENLTAKKAVS